MPIGKSLKLQKIKEEIKKTIDSNISAEYKKEICGRLLMDFARNYSFKESNEIVMDLNLSSVGIQLACPALKMK